MPVDDPVGRRLCMQAAKGDNTGGALHADAHRQDLVLLGRGVKDPHSKGSSNTGLHHNLDCVLYIHQEFADQKVPDVLELMLDKIRRSASVSQTAWKRSSMLGDNLPGRHQTSPTGPCQGVHRAPEVHWHCPSGKGL